MLICYPNLLEKVQILTGNDLGILGNLAALPNEDEIDNYLDTSEEFGNLKQEDILEDVVEKRAQKINCRRKS